MRILDMIKRFCTNPAIRFGYLNRLGWYKRLDDKEFLQRGYELVMGAPLNLQNPKTFNEKLQWLKLYDRKPIYTKMVDKYEVKKYVADLIGEEYIIPTLGIWNHFDDINIDNLPNQFVLKCTHDSGSLAIIRDKGEFILKDARKKFKASLKRNYYYEWREWPYKNVIPRIIAEQYMQDANNTCLPVYKVFCFGGNPYLIQSIQNDKCVDESIDYFDTNWNLLDIRQSFPNSATPLARPAILEEILEKSKLLAKDMSFIRVDWYVVNGKLYFSEFTFYSDAGFKRFEPEEWDQKLGGKIKLPNLDE